MLRTPRLVVLLVVVGFLVGPALGQSQTDTQDTERPSWRTVTCVIHHSVE